MNLLPRFWTLQYFKRLQSLEPLASHGRGEIDICAHWLFCREFKKSRSIMFIIDSKINSVVYVCTTTPEVANHIFLWRHFYLHLPHSCVFGWIFQSAHIRVFFVILKISFLIFFFWTWSGWVFKDESEIGPTGNPSL